MSRVTPLAFIDVDGVLNRFVSAELAARRGYDTVTLTPAILPMSFTLHLDPEDTRRLGELARRFELAWATTWSHDAPRLIAPRLQLPGDWPVAEPDAETAGKVPGILELAGGRPFVWFDDAPAPEDRELLRRSRTPHLLITVPAPYLTLADPAGSTGLTDEHVRRALAWAADLGDSAPGKHPRGDVRREEG
jgi:hypothetical protein